MKKYNFLFILIIIQLLTFCDSSEDNDNTLNLLSYFPTTPGFHLEYDFVTDGTYNSGKRWITFQDLYSDGSARYLYTGELGVTYESFGNAMFYSDTEYIITSRTTTGNNDHRAYWQYLYIPKTTYNGSTYSKNNINFTVTTNTSYNCYPDCIRIDYDSTSGDSDYRGTGYFYLAKNIGIVYLTFTHTSSGRFGDAGESFSYTISNYETLNKNTFSGSITSSTYPILVSICTNTIVRDHYLHTYTDNTGNFSIDFYYKGGTPLTRYALGYDNSPADETFDDSPVYQYYTIASLTDGDHYITQTYNP